MLNTGKVPMVTQTHSDHGFRNKTPVPSTKPGQQLFVCIFWVKEILWVSPK